MISPNADTALGTKKVEAAPKSPKEEGLKLPRRGYLYRVEHCPNPDCLHINSRTRFPAFEGGTGLGLRWIIKNNGKSGCGKKVKIHPLYRELAKIRGLKEGYPVDGDYGIQLIKFNEFFTWEEILPKVLKAIRAHVARKRKMVEVAPPKYPTAEEMRPSSTWDI